MAIGAPCLFSGDALSPSARFFVQHPMLKPPTNVDPTELFLSLLVLPRPERDIPYRLPGAEDIPLRVRALSSTELRSIGSDGAALIRMALLPRLEAPGELFTEPELQEVARAIWRALGPFPAFGHADSSAWSPVLEKAARGTLEGYALSTCLDLDPMTGRSIERPDRYFGVPLSQLIDCHWIAYRAACAAYAPTETKKP